MLIEIHVIQDHGPSNMNRGQDGRPKTALYAGSQRLRISSQCCKRTLRQPRPADNSATGPGVFESIVGSSHFGIRTKLLPERVVERWIKLHGADAPFTEGIKAAISVVAKKDGKQEETKSDGRVRTPQAIYVDLDREVERIISVLNELHDAGELEQLADESQVFADHLKEAASQVGWDMKGKNPPKMIAWESVRNGANWAAILEGVENLDLSDRPAGVDPAATPDTLTPNPELAVGLLKLLQRIEDPEKVKTLLEKLAPSKGPKKKKSGARILLADRLKLTAAQPVSAADIALFGRMTTSDAFQDVEAACQMADAISTHPVDIETDYFTTVDDLDAGTGAAHVGEADYASAVFYKNLVVDYSSLLRNLGADVPRDKQDDETLQTLAAEAAQIAARAIEGLLRATLLNVPSGKINSHAHNQQPSLILVEVKPQKIATSYLTAFHEPARAGEREDGSVETVLTDSVQKLLAFARFRDRKLGIKGAKRFAFANDEQAEQAIERLRKRLTDGSSASELTDDDFFRNSSLQTCDDFESFVAAVNKAVAEEKDSSSDGGAQ
jgi:hypothetical protein